MKRKISFIALMTLFLVLMVACGGDKAEDPVKDSEEVENNSSEEATTGEGETTEKSSLGELSSGEAGLIAGEFTKDIKVFSEGDVKMLYQEDLETKTDVMGYASVELGDFYSVSAKKQPVSSSIDELTEDFDGIYSDYKGYKLYESTYKGYPCLVFMIDKDSELDRDAQLAIYVYIEDNYVVEISVLSVREDLDHILNDPLAMAIVNNVDW